MPTDNGEHLFFIYDMHGLRAEEEEEEEVVGKGGHARLGTGTKMRLIPGDGSRVVPCRVLFLSLFQVKSSIFKTWLIK